MTKTIQTLKNDIYSLVKTRGWFNELLADDLSRDISLRLQRHFNDGGERASLRLSAMGPRCPRALWFSVHHPELREPLPPWATIKFSFGHILEAEAIAFARAAGHAVTGEGDELEVDGVKGHRDCVIDGAIVDVKSASTPNFKKFESGAIAQSDSFGYLEQLDGYVVGSRNDPLVTVKDRGYLLAIDKTLGHVCIYEHKIREEHIHQRIAESKRICGLSDPPSCECGVESEGSAGNLTLDVKASYSAYKHCCFPNLRICIGSKGPRYFVKVVKWPHYQGQPLPEVDRDGRFVN